MGLTHLPIKIIQTSGIVSQQSVKKISKEPFVRQN
jgi:hypothetical protein